MAEKKVLTPQELERANRFRRIFTETIDEVHCLPAEEIVKRILYQEEVIENTRTRIDALRSYLREVTRVRPRSEERTEWKDKGYDD